MAVPSIAAYRLLLPIEGAARHVIRSADGNNTLGAGVLAEKIVEAMLAAAPTYKENKE